MNEIKSYMLAMGISSIGQKFFQIADAEELFCVLLNYKEEEIPSYIGGEIDQYKLIDLRDFINKLLDKNDKS